MNTKSIEKNKSRLEVLKRIEEYEKNGWWSRDVEDDPPTIPLTPDKVDYLNKKLSNKIATFFVNIGAKFFIKKLIKNKQLIIKDVLGRQNYEKIKDSGVIITCNHFNAFDNFAIHYALLPYMYNGNGKVLYKVIREGNFTNFPGLYGFFFRHCNTLPLSANFSTMKNFMQAVKTLLARKEKILIYAEQGMWWNYRKPRPMASGSFRFAAENNVPVLPIFITMEDSEIIGSDGFPVQIYTVNMLEPIFPDPQKSVKQNTEEMKEKNYQAWKKCYEDFYKIPLTYSTSQDDGAAD